MQKIINSKLELSKTNNKDSFKRYIETSQKENLILRYEDLADFILATKTERLNKILEIIGFDNVLKIRDILRKGKNEIDRMIKVKDFDSKISRCEGEIMEKLGERIVDDNSFVNKVNTLIQPLNLEPISTINDIDTMLKRLANMGDTPLIKKCDYFEKTKNAIKFIEEKVPKLTQLYQEFFSSYNQLLQDIESLKQLFLENLWNVSLNLLRTTSLWEEDKCPLCFQNKDKQELISEIEERLTKITKVKEKKEKLGNLKNEIEVYIKNFHEEIAFIENSDYFRSNEFEPLKNFITIFKDKNKEFQNELRKDFLKMEQIKAIEAIYFPDKIFSKTIQFCESKYNEAKNQLRGGKISELHTNLALSWERYKEIKRYKKEKAILESYSRSMACIYYEFFRKLKIELDKFIAMFSSKLNEYYMYMHPGENISNTQTKFIEENDELKGLTIEYEFHKQCVAPPQKYLSESHLNSLGIALFLTSVEAFNKENKFFILDDIISSFDTNHRMRLSNLLLDKFKDYQIIVLTHEKDWFDLMNHLVKGKGWYINVIKWSKEHGAYFEPSLVDLKATIEKKINNNEEVGLGNLIRQFLEKILKDIAEVLEIRMPYRSNERNEQRMCREMLSYLKSDLNKQPCKEIFDKEI